MHFSQNYIDDGKRKRFFVSHDTYHFVPIHYRKQHNDTKQYGVRGLFKKNREF